MADVATLGIAVESTGVDKGAKSLDNLANAAKKAEAATQGVSASTKNAGAAAMSASAGSSKAAAALNQESAAATKAAGALRLHAAAANQNMASFSKFNTSNIAAQFQDIAVSAQMGMGALQIGLQQGTQLAAVISTMENPVRGLGAAFLSVLSPVSLLVIGLTSLAAAGLQMVNWPKLAASALMAVAGALQTVAPYAVGAAAALALLYAPAIIAGLTVVSEAILGVTARLIGLAIGFAAANPALAFIVGITAAVAAANVFRDELTNIFGVDIVGAAKTGVNFIIGSFVGAFNDLKFVWSQFPNIIGAAAVGAANAAIGAIEKMINAATGMLNSLIESVNGALSKLPGGFSIGTIGNVDFGQIDNPYSDALAGAVGDRNAALQGALSKDYLGGFGAAIAQGASTASDKLKELAASLTNVEAAAGKAGGAGKKAGEDTAAGFDTAKVAANQAKEAMSFAKDVVGGFLSDFKQGMESGKGVWQSFADAASRALDKITDKLLNQMLDAIFQVNGAVGGGGSGGGGGFLSSLFGGLFGGGTSYFPPAPGLSPGLFANGGTFMHGVSGYSNSVVNRPTMFAFAKGTGLMGEAGPEAIMPLKRDGSGRLGVAVNDNKGGGGKVEINIINNAGAKVTKQERQTANGTAIDVMIDEAVAKKIGTPGSASRNAMQSNFGLKGGLARR
ncbi:phage tail length tape measure family protein [Rhizobium sp. P32RR-XVIII]|uniref:phage tail length tape measure family protein n=1 Tax=Rhizobium sp. P32RR-XVIII TaxID=2726738 RepID=UPI00197D1C42|nr:phage tail length tape measure family protein [Rhizobium sp. P32RR-XVIII]